MKSKVTARVVSQREIAPQIYDLWLETELAAQAHPGQFIGVYTKDNARLLPRPISICEVDADRKCLRLVYRIAGHGTAEFAGLDVDDQLQLLGVLGNGFPLEETKGKKVLIMGGGIGIPPLIQLIKEAEGTKTAVLGYRDANLFLKDEFEYYGKVLVATEDGSVGTKGNVLDAVREQAVQADVIMACGPMPMLRAIKKYAAEKGIKAYISLEEHMACGVGACLGCVVKTTKEDHHSHVNNARICTEGPVFLAEDVDI